MSTVQELRKRADELRNKTAVNSITPDEVGSLIFDTIDYMYSIESSGIFKMMSSLADTTNPSAADQIPVIGAEIAQKASITTVVGKGLQNAETQTELDSVPVIRGTKVGQMAKSDIAVKLCESFEQNLPTYRPNTDTFDQIRIRKSETGESYYISKEDLAEVVGGLIPTSIEYMPNTDNNVYITRYGRCRTLIRTASGGYMSEILSYILLPQDRPKSSITIPTLIMSNENNGSLGFLFIETSGVIQIRVIGDYNGKELELTASNTRGYTNLYAINATWIV